MAKSTSAWFPIGQSWMGEHLLFGPGEFPPWGHGNPWTSSLYQRKGGNENLVTGQGATIHVPFMCRGGLFASLLLSSREAPPKDKRNQRERRERGRNSRPQYSLYLLWHNSRSPRGRGCCLGGQIYLPVSQKQLGGGSIRMQDRGPGGCVKVYYCLERLYPGPCTC